MARQELEKVDEKKRTKAEQAAKQKYLKRRRSQFASAKPQLMLALIERDGYRCARCGAIEELTIDHILPLSKGGTDDLANLRILCKKHNSKKGARPPDDFNL